MQKYAVLSVSDKREIPLFAKELCELDYKILSTGGTLDVLRKHGIEVIDISTYTESQEMFDGRVKTLHPKVHGGILFRRNKAQDIQQAREQGIVSIDLVCVNLYPFYETTQRSDDFDEIIENIDIGGPSLIRAAAKNFASVMVVVDPKDYKRVIQFIQTQKKCADSQKALEFRRELMIQAFNHTANYECLIANYMNEKFAQGFGDKKFIVGSKVMQTNYGENPHQEGALYEFQDFYSKYFRVLKGNISFNNLTDINSAIKIASAFGDVPCVCIIKHGNPCGFAIKETLMAAYQSAMICDSVSAYGGVVAMNGELDRDLATEILKSYVEVVVCAKAHECSLKMFQDKKRIKIVEYSYDVKNECSKSKIEKPNSARLCFSPDIWDFKHIQGGFVYQQSDSVESNEVINAQVVSEKVARENQKYDLEIAYKLAAFTKSNCVVFVKDGILLAIGMGMTSRVDAMFAAMKKAKEMGVSLMDSSLASEAFFPFKDSIELAASVGVSAIIEPGGSIRDKEVIQEANKQGIALYFSGRRHFLH